MNEVLDAIKTRRSVKAYKPDMVPQELIDQVIEAGTWAPTGMNRQAPVILAVTDKVIRDRLSDMNRRVMGAPEGMDPFYGAPVVLVVLADRDAALTWQYDGSLVLGNMLLAAHALGLGGCWIHRAKEEFETEEGKAILEKAGLTGNLVGIGHCVIGYPKDGLPTPKPRKDGWVAKL
ncbi:MAG: nitroreductase [Clostridia bacterium]|nr:nitroreductase [Clostridia bacterium]